MSQLWSSSYLSAITVIIGTRSVWLEEVESFWVSLKISDVINYDDDDDHDHDVFIIGFGILLYALPHFIIGAYEPSLTGPRGPTCFSGNITESEAKCSQKSDSRWYYMAIFVLAQLIMGAAISPFYSLLPAYLDENVHPKHMPVYLGVWSFANFLGPGIGMIVGGKLLSTYVDLKQVRFCLINNSLQSEKQ